MSADGGVAGITRQLAEFAVGTDQSSLPEATSHAAQRLILDTLACAIGAVSTAPGRAVLDLKREQGGRPEATLVATPDKVPAVSAAYAHAQMANVLDADETLYWSHSACAVVMPAIAVAERVGASGAELIAAVAAGFDIGVRIGFSMPAFGIDASGHLTRAGAMGFSWAAYGAAAAAGKLLGLSAEQLAHAFGIAHVSMPAHGSAVAFKGLSEPWHKYSMYAAIAEAGVNAALLASRGYLSDPGVFDDGTEFFTSMNAASSDRAAIVAGLGRDWAVERTALKPWPFCRYSHGALDAFHEVVDTHGLKPDDIDSVTITVPPFSFIEMIARSVDVTDKLKIMTSLPYALAMVAHRVPPGPKWWADEVFDDPAIHSFATRVHAEVDEGLNERFLAGLKAGDQLSASTVPGQIRVSAQADVFESAIERGVGDPADPAKVFSDAALRAKVIEFTDGVLAPGAGAAIADAAFALDRAANLDALMDPCAEAAR